MSQVQTDSAVIEIRDVGPIIEASLEVVPGVNVLTGENEVGKSTFLLGIMAIAGNKEAKLTPRDGAKRGEVKGLGVVLSVGKQQRPTGALDVAAVDDRVDISDLVEPPVKKPDVVLRHRIKALISLQGTKLGLSDFLPILPTPKLAEDGITVEGDDWRGELQESMRDDDPVEMAGKIKRAMEKRKREFESSTERVRGQLDGLRARLEGIDFSKEHDAAKLTQAVIDATKAREALQQQKREAIRMAASIEEARQAMDNASNAAGVDLSAARTKSTEAKAVVTETEGFLEEAKRQEALARTHVESLRKMLTEAEATLTTRETATANAKKTLADKQALAKQADENVASIEQTVANAGTFRDLANKIPPTPPSEDDLEAADEEVSMAIAAAGEGQKIRDAIIERERLVKLEEEERKSTQTALMFADAASGTDDILSKAVNARLLKVREGDLVYTEGDRVESYSRLSEGKRWQIALVTAAEALASAGRFAIVPVQQRAWEGLTAKNRLLVYETAIEAGVAVVTAEKKSGQPLSSYRWTPGAA